MRYFHYAVNSCVNFFPGLRLHSKQFCIFSVRSGVSAGGVVRGGTRGVGKTNTQYAATALERGCHTHRLPGHPPSLTGQHFCYGNRTGFYLQLTVFRARSQCYDTEKKKQISVPLTGLLHSRNYNGVELVGCKLLRTADPSVSLY